VKNQPPNAAEKRWREDVRKLGSIVSHRRPCEIHHCAGRTAKHNKIRIGHYFILPLVDDEHERIPDLGHDRKRWEKEMFDKLLFVYARQYGRPAPVPDEVIEAIRSYRR
jgi:hypothetical protein